MHVPAKYRFVNEMRVDGAIYTAYRNPKKPTDCLIVRDDESVKVEKLSAIWKPEILPTLF